MIARHALPALSLLAGCLLFEPMPCSDALCPDGFACAVQGEGCLDECTAEVHCQDGFHCAPNGQCVPFCIDDECPGYFSCDSSYFACNSYCESDFACRDGAICCTAERYHDGACPERFQCSLP